MKLTQVGPDVDATGELTSKLIAETDDLDALKTTGLAIADDMGAKHVMWTWGPVRTWYSLEVIPERCYLAIRP